MKMLAGNGGCQALLGMKDMKEISRRAEAGEEPFHEVLEAMLYTVSKQIGAMAVALWGKADAIILTGGLAREIALKNGIDPRRSASLLDIFSCVFQGLIPWAAQLLLAGSLAKISPLEITINNWYCMLLAVAGILAIILGLPRIKARSTEA